MFKSLKLLLLVGGLALAASPAFAVTAKTGADVKFLSGPGKDYAAVGILPAGAKVAVVWCGTRANYCLVQIHHLMGWVPFASLTFSTKTDVALVLEDGSGNGPSGPKGPGPSAPPDTSNGPQEAKPMVDDVKPQVVIIRRQH